MMRYDTSAPQTELFRRDKYYTIDWLSFLTPFKNDR